MAAHSATLSWIASTDSGEAGFAGYNIYRSTVSGAEAAPALNGATPINALTFTDTTIVAGQQYFYIVTAVANGLESVHSAEVSGSAPFSAPAPPTGLAVHFV